MPNGSRLFIDIRSGSVGAAVASPGEKEGTHDVSISTRRNLPILAAFKGERLLSAMLGELRELLKEVRSSNPGSFSKVHVTIASPWFYSETKTIRHTSETDSKCDKEWIRKMVEAETSEFMARNFSDRSPEIVEKVIMRVSLNGYETRRPFGKLAKEQVFTLYASAVETQTVSSIRKALADALGSHRIELHTMPLSALPAAASVVSPDTSSYVVLDIGGEVSEFFLVRDRLISDSFSIPIGAHGVLRDMATELKSSTEEARAVYAAYQEGELDEAIRKRVEHSLGLTEVKWRTYAKSILEKISARAIIPPLVVLICTTRTGDILKKVFESADIAELFPQKASPGLIRPSPESIGINYKGQPGRSRSDIFLAVEISSIDKIELVEYS